MNIFSERLKELREEDNLTQSQLADLLNTGNTKVLPQNISYWEKGRQPPFEILNKLAMIFNVTTDYLTGRSDFKNSTQELLFTKFELSNSLKDIEHNDKRYLIESIESLLKTSLELYEIDSNILTNWINFLLALQLLMSKYSITYFASAELSKSELNLFLDEKGVSNSINILTLSELLTSELSFYESSKENLNSILNLLQFQIKESLLKKKCPYIFDLPFKLIKDEDNHIKLTNQNGKST